MNLDFIRGYSVGKPNGNILVSCLEMKKLGLGYI
jgi:hypothetical protein